MKPVGFGDSESKNTLQPRDLKDSNLSLKMYRPTVQTGEECSQDNTLESTLSRHKHEITKPTWVLRYHGFSARKILEMYLLRKEKKKSFIYRHIQLIVFTVDKQTLFLKIICNCSLSVMKISTISR